MVTAEINGEVLTVNEIANRYGLLPSTVRSRIARGLRGPDIIAINRASNARDLCKAKTIYDCFHCPWPDCIRSPRRPLVGEPKYMNRKKQTYQL